MSKLQRPHLLGLSSNSEHSFLRPPWDIHRSKTCSMQHLAGHADPRTIRLYARRQKKVTRNLVDRISI